MKSRKVRLLRRAATALRNIGRWTEVNFGAAQAVLYLADLRQGTAGIAADTVPTWDCSSMVKGAPEGYRFARVGQHFIIYVESPDEVAILDVIHQRMDLPGKIATLVTKPESR